MSKKEDFSSLIKKAKNNTADTPKQKVVPVASGAKQEDEIQFSFYIKKSTLKSLKIKATMEETSIKALINQYIEKGLNTQ